MMASTSQNSISLVARYPEGKSRVETYWLILAVSALVVLLIAAIRWSLAHPFGIHWDESGYLNEALIDAQRLRNGMLVKWAGRILLKSYVRPPAYRLLGGPAVALFGPSTTVARLVSLSCFALSTRFIYLSARSLGGRVAGAIAALIFCLSPDVIAASIFFSTDAPLYLAISAMLYYLIRISVEPSEHPNAWFGLGAAVGLGFLAKTSFLLIGPPALACWCISAPGRATLTRRPLFVTKAAAVVLALAAPWWLLNAKGALAYGQFARGTVRNSLGSPSVATLFNWLNSVFQCLLGHAVSLVILFVLIAFAVQILKHAGGVLAPNQKLGLGICACAGVPIVLAQFSGTNHLLRYISPAVIPLAIVVAVLADQTFWTRSATAAAILSLLFVAQLGMITYPVVVPNTAPVDIGFANGVLPWRTMARFDQWDWRPIREISRACNIDSPRISFMGSGREFDPPAIQYPWAAAAFPTRLSTFAFPDALWLWRYEDGPVDWQKLMASTANSDMVITAPEFIGEVRVKEDRDNQHNVEFAGRLSADSQFQGPIIFTVGRFTPVHVAVFVKRTFTCRSDQMAFESLGIRP